MTWALLEHNGFTTLDERIIRRFDELRPMAELLALRALVVAVRNEEIVPLNALDEIGRDMPRLNHYVRELVAKGIWTETEWGWRMDCGGSRHRTIVNDRWKMHAGLRAEVLALHGQACKACGTTARIVIDHIVPVAKGGKTELENLQPLCSSCNGSKGTKSWDEFLQMRGR